MQSSRSMVFIKLLVIFSPLLISFFVYEVGDEFASVPFLGPVVLGIPTIAFLGWLTARKASKTRIVLLGYIIPALIINGYGLYLSWPML